MIFLSDILSPNPVVITRSGFCSICNHYPGREGASGSRALRRDTEYWCSHHNLGRDSPHRGASATKGIRTLHQGEEPVPYRHWATPLEESLLVMQVMNKVHKGGGLRYLEALEDVEDEGPYYTLASPRES